MKSNFFGEEEERRVIHPEDVEFTETRSDGTPDPNSFGIVETVDMYPGGPILNIEKGQWHSLKCLESGTVLFEAKDGPYHPLGEDEVFNPENI